MEQTERDDLIKRLRSLISRDGDCNCLRCSGIREAISVVKGEPQSTTGGLKLPEILPGQRMIPAPLPATNKDKPQ